MLSNVTAKKCPCTTVMKVWYWKCDALINVEDDMIAEDE